MSGNMTDRELLEAAARAAGYGEVWYLDGSDTPYVGPRFMFGEPVQYRIFKPLTDDGDALRLAAILRLTVGDDDQSVRSMAFAYRHDLPRCYEPSQQDPAAAYRRAIVRAAAALATTPDGQEQT